MENIYILTYNLIIKDLSLDKHVCCKHLYTYEYDINIRARFDKSYEKQLSSCGG